MISLSAIPKMTSIRGSKGTDVPAAYLEKFIDDATRDYGLELDPDFQRGHVWTAEQQTKYIEHRLRGGTSGNIIYMNCPAFGSGDNGMPMQIVDGKQRLTAVRKFLADEVTVFGGNKFSDFDANDQRAIVGLTGILVMRVEINTLQNRSEVLQWYLELNEGAVAHTPEELARVAELLRTSKLSPEQLAAEEFKKADPADLWHPCYNCNDGIIDDEECSVCGGKGEIWAGSGGC